jgi:hypothetical protein
LNGKLKAPAGAPAPAGPEPVRDGGRRRIVREISLALAVYGMAGWIYVAICALAAPQTLALPLTHLLPHLREDTSGVLAFLISLLGFISYRLTREDG